MLVLGAAVLAAVFVVVPEVPCRGGADELPASPARDCAGRDLGCPLLAESVVVVAVPSGLA